MDADEFGTGTFQAFLKRWLAVRGICDLFTVSGSAEARAPAIKRNEIFIAEQRQSLREELHAAACTGRIVWHDGPMVDVFVPDGHTTVTAVQLEELGD